MGKAAIIQARMGSTRLPGKALKDICGKSMLERVVERVKKAKTIDGLIIATTVREEDDQIVAECKKVGVPVFRGNPEDLLDRYYQCAKRYGVQNVIRITSDCPLIEPEVIDLVVGKFFEVKPDYASNTLPPRTYPRGLDVEIFSFDALELAWREDEDPAWREHVTPYIYRHPEKFKLHAVTNDADYSYMRWTVDTPEDLVLVRKIYGHFGDDVFSWHDVIKLLENHPEWLEINKHVVQKELKV
ncbi:MAG TPA: glycosyltransferase family protein [Thermosynergistes sp.]|nr:glycosyltransferase family protein [Thermosynergistes sp.]HPZ76726.1 glycosyltransferase family protein [Thermosynergistes sp.]